jgi:DNA-binding transcriptional regulator YdaS (Cro superfamily)
MEHQFHHILISVIARAGSKTKYAAVVGCSQPNITQLIKRKRPIPVGHVRTVCAEFGLKAKMLRPDIYSD